MSQHCRNLNLISSSSCQPRTLPFNTSGEGLLRRGRSAKKTLLQLFVHIRLLPVDAKKRPQRETAAAAVAVGEI
eukprot:scaffold26701_cov77-Skeletonema_dohrnii-CCMP3373.AAC.1